MSKLIIVTIGFDSKHGMADISYQRWFGVEDDVSDAEALVMADAVVANECGDAVWDAGERRWAYRNDRYVPVENYYKIEDITTLSDFKEQAAVSAVVTEGVTDGYEVLPIAQELGKPLTDRSLYSEVTTEAVLIALLGALNLPPYHKVNVTGLAGGGARVSFYYADSLTGRVEVDHCDDCLMEHFWRELRYLQEHRDPAEVDPINPDLQKLINEE